MVILHACGCIIESPAAWWTSDNLGHSSGNHGQRACSQLRIARLACSLRLTDPWLPSPHKRLAAPSHIPRDTNVLHTNQTKSGAFARRLIGLLLGGSFTGASRKESRPLGGNNKITMNSFPKLDQPDEGYSEHPLNPPVAAGDNVRNAHLALGSLRSAQDFPAWLQRNLPTLPIAIKSRKQTLPLVSPVKTPSSNTRLRS